MRFASPIRLSITQLAMLAAALCLSAPTVAQQRRIETLDEAKSRAAQFAEALDLGLDVKSFASELAEPPGPEARSWWSLYDPRGGASISIDPATGKVISLGQARVSYDIMETDRSHMEPRIQTERDAIALAERFLEAAGHPRHQYNWSTVEWPGRPPNGSRDLKIGGSRVVVRYEERVPNLPGTLNEASVTLDTVTGRIERGRASSHWKYSPPDRLLNRTEVLAAMRSAFAAARADNRDRGAAWAEAAWSWPGDDVVSRGLELRLVTHTPGGPPFTKGRRNGIQWIARQGWYYYDDKVAMVIDAETGEGLGCGLVKSSSRPASSQRRDGSMRREKMPFAPKDQATDPLPVSRSIDPGSHRSPASRQQYASDGSPQRPGAPPHGGTALIGAALALVAALALGGQRFLKPTGRD
ncbi:MAG: hypothetical protein KF884_09750 [Fimbriimonadaceae bacterium]|nr:hypothetical protein [Fimbriimonadaceae bacterium]QYK57830.1 MAG: hypothetical protein KF884_09750 [Fimbriimonadaceae bacterium]